jgi:hypothetical protein
MGVSAASAINHIYKELVRFKYQVILTSPEMAPHTMRVSMACWHRRHTRTVRFASMLMSLTALQSGEVIFGLLIVN